MTDERYDELANRLDAIDGRLSTLLVRVDTLIKRIKAETSADDPRQLPGYKTHAVTEVEHYISGSGNPTWKAFTEAGDIIYLRQAHKQLLTDANGLWGELNRMHVGERANMCIDLGTVPDGDFLKPVFIGEWTSDIQQDDDDDHEHTQTWAEDDENDPFRDLQRLVGSGNFVVLDTETTDLNGFVCQIAVIDPDGKTLLHRLVKPVTPISAAAARIHGITNEMVANAVTFDDPSCGDELRNILVGKQVIGWNVGFDHDALLRSAAAYDIPRIESLIRTTPFIDLMQPYSDHVAKEWNEYHGNYKWQKLTAAARHYGISINGAHDAMTDAQMTLAVLKAMVS